jgi:hypothetical protein
MTCPVCNQAQEASVWLIVDVAERPELVERICAETLHTLTCSSCGNVVHTIDAPVLVYHRDLDPPVLFSPAERTTDEHDQAHAAQLVQALRERLADEWQNHWLADGLTAVPRALLPAALEHEITRVAHAFGNQRRPLVRVLQQFIQTKVVARCLPVRSGEP